MKRLLVLSILIIFISCAPIYVNYDYETGTDFSQYKSYNVYPQMQIDLSELDTKRLLDAFDEVIQAKGFVISDAPDFYVNIKSSQFQSASNSNVGVGVGGTSGNVGGGISVGIPVGQANINQQLIFDFIDADKDALFWQAVSESGFNPNATPEIRKERFKEIVTKVLSGFPPEK